MEYNSFPCNSSAPIQYADDSAIETSAITTTDEVHALADKVQTMELGSECCEPNSKKLIAKTARSLKNSSIAEGLASLEFQPSYSKFVATLKSVVDGLNHSAQNVELETAELAPPKQESMCKKKSKKDKRKESASRGRENQTVMKIDCYDISSGVVVLKEVNEANIQVLLQVTSEIFCKVYIGKFIKRIQDSVRFRFFRLAYIDDIAIGAVTLFPEWSKNALCIKSFGIIRGYRRNGFADSLMQFVWSVKNTFGVSQVAVNVPINHYRGIRYFEKLGFKLRGVDTDCESTMIRGNVYRFESI